MIEVLNSTNTGDCVADLGKSTVYNAVCLVLELLNLLGAVGVSLKFVRYTNEVR